LTALEHGIGNDAGCGSGERQMLAVFQCTQHPVDGRSINQRHCDLIESRWALLALPADARLRKCSAAV
tara:strand:- start:1518 stop:1721 length:204 start_codon:yes stop_codon:yes gene_type:complete